jgi:hypothetical protein
MKSPSAHDKAGKLDLDELLHPSKAFEHPADVVGDPDLTLNEKRAILASWASDSCAVEATPALRSVPGAVQPVIIDEILDALRTLDKEGNALPVHCSRPHGGFRPGSIEAFQVRRTLVQVDGRAPN